MNLHYFTFYSPSMRPGAGMAVMADVILNLIQERHDKVGKGRPSPSCHCGLDPQSPNLKAASIDGRSRVKPGMTVWAKAAFQQEKG